MFVTNSLKPQGCYSRKEFLLNNEKELSKLADSNQKVICYHLYRKAVPYPH